MTALKGRAIDQFLERPDLESGVILVYGPDAGRVSETADKLAARFAGPDPDPMSTISLGFHEIEADPGRLIAEADSASLFAAGQRIVRLRGATAALAPTVAAMTAAGTASIVILEAGPLGAGDALRKVAQAPGPIRALPCYGDDEQALGRLVRQSFQQAGIAAEPDAIRTLLSILGNDRAVTRSEIEKLTLFAADTGRLTAGDVLALCGDNAALAWDQVSDAVGTGHTQEFDAAFSRSLAAGTDVSAVLGAVLAHFAALRAMRAEFDAGKSPDAITRTFRVHFSRAAAVQSQIRAWSDQALGRAAARLHETVLTTRRQPDLAVAAARQTLLSLTVSAARF